MYDSFIELDSVFILLWVITSPGLENFYELRAMPGLRLLNFNSLEDGSALNFISFEDAPYQLIVLPDYFEPFWISLALSFNPLKGYADYGVVLWFYYF